MPSHSFDTEDASKYGILPAVILHNIRFWTEKNRANNRHCYEGKTWVYNSVSAWVELFPYATKDQIRRAIEKLRDEGVLEVGNFNQSAYDRTAWYCLSCQIQVANLPNGSGADATPIPVSNPISKPDGKQASQAPTSAKRKKSDNLTLVKWAELQKEQGTPLLSDDDAIFAYADTIKLPKDFLLIAWHMFKAKYKGSAKTYKDWRAAFRDHVRCNYLKAWAINRDGEFYLTDAGKQAQMERGAL